MLEITGDIGGLVNEAVATNSTEDLIKRLTYLNQWGEDHRYTVLVRGAIIDPKRREMGLGFLNKAGKAFMNGGLVYHESSNTWGVHT